MTPSSWPCPLPGGGTCEEFALQFDAGRTVRLLVVPALFDEGNRMRRFTVEVMRRLDTAGIDSFLPDFPGCNESLQALEAQDPTDWLDAMTAAARHFNAGHVLGIRGGCLFTPQRLPAFHYAPVKAASILRQMVRARILASREAGREENREQLAQTALADGITLAGYELGADFYRHFEPMAADDDAVIVAQEHLGGSGLWLRAEPDENAAQADALAAILASALAS
ncbi:hypothetical protein [Novosphingobium sp. P6W]|uniref:hypothetical protein n=1 Tax=Novosphingobium sp. P6W TaxID=1609758 RepID=UPI0005C2A360|nr:hypothetical protein [Novosphingobium sp. P6W]AXB76954.1 hypothetical protein TQ38_010980 [Novosphingobium sp. P6W]KIS33564.1 hypothetical protein TQ38_07150 [Novosphingobium sp. P6W]